MQAEAATVRDLAPSGPAIPITVARKRSAGEEPVEGIRPRKQSKTSVGDAELTESDSEADSLFQEDELPVATKTEDPGEETGPAALQQEQLLQRRLDNTSRLRQMYISEYWALLEEFRARHDHILKKARQTSQEDGGRSPIADNQPGLQEQFVSMQTLMQQAPLPSKPVPDVKPEAADATEAGLSAAAAAPGADPTSAGSPNTGPWQPMANGHVSEQAADGQGVGVKHEPREDMSAIGKQMSGEDAPSGVARMEADETGHQPDRSTAGPQTTQVPGPGSQPPTDVHDADEPCNQPQEHAPVPDAQPGGSREGSLEAQPAPDVPDFEHVKSVVFSASPSLPVASQQQLFSWRAAFRSRLQEISRLEQASAAAGAREMDADGALAVLLSHGVQYTIRRAAASLGRNTGSCGQVDVDLTMAGCAKRVSRQQAMLALGPDGKFALRNIGRRAFFVNSRMVNQGQVAPLTHLSHLDIGGLQLLFLINHLAVQRAMHRTQQQSLLGPG